MDSAALGGDAPDPQEALLEFLYRAPIGLLQTLPDGAVTMANPMAAQLLMPLSAGGAGLDNLFDLLAPWAPGLRAQAAACTDPGTAVCDNLRLLVQLPGQPPRTLGLTLTWLATDMLIGSVTDISHQVHDEQQRLAGQLRDASRTDPLTGLPNRAVARERIDAALAVHRAAATQGPAVLFINIDRFEQTNLAHGHAVGDALLQCLALRLAATLDVLPGCTVARLGGDEFAAVLGVPGDGESVQRTAQRLLQALSQPCQIDGRLLRPAVSIGLAPGPSSADADADALLQDAGIAMREARRSGGAQVVSFDPAMKARATWRSLIEADLRAALSEPGPGHGGLSVAYQPIVALDGTAVLGIEALVRWQHPQRGALSPLEFIAVAEQTGLIEALGLFVLDAACHQFMQWRVVLGAAAPQWLSVNLSRAQLAQPELAAQVQQVLAATGMPAQALQLEVTESLAAQDDAVRGQLQALKALGLTLALDDFGTGYSSLSSLHQLPVDVVKIDRSFVMQLETSAHHRALVKATVDVAQSLGMATVAEGVETPGQASLLQALHCTKGQGFGFGRPMPGVALGTWLADWPARRAVWLRPAQPLASDPAGASRSPSGSAA